MITYNHNYKLMIGGAVIRDWDCVATIAADPDKVADWYVSAITLNGMMRANDPDQGFAAVDVDLPDDHWLYDRILADLIKVAEREIDELWAQHVAVQLSLSGPGKRRVALVTA
jgi:hypothetical protein